MRCKPGFWSAAFCLIVTAASLLPHPSIAGGDSGVTPEIRAALLAGDWGTVARLLDDVGLDHSSPVLRFLKGHACLALNRNNESFRYFALTMKEDHDAWFTWTGDLVRAHPGSSIAHFCHGDALARQERVDEAIAHFDKSLAIDPDNVYALHARGVLRVLLGDFAEAGKDLSQAQRTSPGVAEFYNSRGMLRIAQRQGNVVRVEDLFRRAVDLSESFALAHHGLGCIELLRNPDADIDSSKSLQHARDTLPEAISLYAINEMAYELALLEGYLASLGDLVGDDEAGMGIRRSVEERSTMELVNHHEHVSRTNAGARVYMAPGGLPVVVHTQGTPQQLSRAIANRTNQWSNSQIEEFARANPEDALRIANAIAATRVSESEHRRYDALEKQVNAASDLSVGLLSVAIGGVGGGGLAVLYGTARAHGFTPSDGISRPPRVDPAEDRAEAIRIDRFRGAVTYNRATHGLGTTTPEGYRGSIRLSEPGPAMNMQPPDAVQPSRAPASQPAGATMDKQRVVWDTTPWPFSPLFSLLYTVPTDSAIDATSATDSDIRDPMEKEDRP